MSIHVKRLLSSCLIMATLVATLSSPSPVRASANIYVTTTGDEYNTNSNCSLREAIVAANENRTVSGCAAGTTGMDYINLPSGTFALNIQGIGENAAKTGDLDITESVTINGVKPEKTHIYGATTFGDRLFHIRTNKTPVYIFDLRMSGGSANPYSATDPDIGGAIFNENSDLYLMKVLIEKNHSDNTGGGIGNGVNSYLNVNASTVTNNTATNGGGIFNAGNVLLKNSMISDNHATNQGGGFLNNIIHMTPDSKDTATMENVTFYSNYAGYGAGIYSDNYLDLMNVTIVDNDGIGLMSSGMGSIRNSIIGRHSPASNCNLIENAVTLFVTLGNNMEDMNQCKFSTAKKDIINLTSAGLGLAMTPAKNGGPTDTFALEEGSPAIDAIESTCPNIDQRMMGRPADGPDLYGKPTACDIGAYEYGAVNLTFFIPLVRR